MATIYVKAVELYAFVLGWFGGDITTVSQFIATIATCL